MVEEKLPLYLVASSTTIVLTRKDNQLHLSIYHMSKVLSDVKTMYSPLEKITFAHVRKLHPYFQTYTMAILMEYPFRIVL